MKNLTGKLTTISHTKFWVLIFSFLQKWHHAYLLRAYTKAEVSLHIGYYIGFQPHLAHERTSPHPTQNIITLTLTFVPTNQNILLGDFTLYNFASLHWQYAKL